MGDREPSEPLAAPSSPAPRGPDEPRPETRSSSKRQREEAAGVPPQEVVHSGARFVLDNDFRGASRIYEHVVIYKPVQKSIGVQIHRCTLTAQHRLYVVKEDQHKGIFKPDQGNTSNIIKYFRDRAYDTTLSLEQRFPFAMAVLDVQGSNKGGPVGQTVLTLSDGVIKKESAFLSPESRRPHHMRAAVMLADTHMPFEFFNSQEHPSVKAWLQGLNPKYNLPPPSTIKDCLIELYVWECAEQTKELQELRVL